MRHRLALILSIVAIPAYTAAGQGRPLGPVAARIDVRAGPTAGVAAPAPVWGLDMAASAGNAGAYQFGWSATAADGDTLARPAWGVRATISRRFGSRGVWLGAGPQSAGGAGAVIGTWAQVGGALFTATLESDRRSTLRRSVRPVQRYDSIYTDTSGWQRLPVAGAFTYDTADIRGSQLVPAIALRADWATGRWAFSASASRRARVDSLTSTTVAASVAADVARGVGLIASAGASSSAAQRSQSRYVSFGVRLWSPSVASRAPAPVRPLAQAFALQGDGAGRYRIRFRVPFARTVDITGDFNGWTSTALGETSPGVWEVTLPLSPGVHSLNVRINGEAWTVPPGVRWVHDEFNGRVGIVVVP
jgi:hypothetical protein